MHCYVGTDDGLLRIDVDAGAAESLGFQGTSVRAIHRGPDGRLWIGTRGDEAVSGLHVLDPAGGETRGVAPRIGQAWSIVHAPGDDSVLFVGTLPPALYRSEDAGATWREVESFQQVDNRHEWTFFGGPETAHVRSLSVCPDLPGVIAAGIEVGGVIVSEDGGASWEDRTGPVDEDVHSVHLFRTAPGRLMATCQAGVFLSDDLGRTWESRPQVTGYFVPICASADEQTFLSTSVHGRAPVYRSDDAGWTWRAVGKGLPSPAFGADNVAIDPTDPDRVVYAGSVGKAGTLHSSSDGGATWEKILDLSATPRRVRIL